MNRQQLWQQSFSDPIVFVATGFASGLSRIAPGTVGTLVTFLFYPIIQPWPLAWQWLLITLGFILGCWLCGTAAQRLGVADHPAIVFDEITGFALTLSFLSFSFGSYLLGFILFRLLDALKPWPISWLDKNIHGGLGIMLDDLLAGFLAGFVLFLLGF